MANYTPTSTSRNDYTKILQVGDIIHGTAGQTIPITVPAGTYRLECYGAQGAYGMCSTSGSTSYTLITSSNYSNYFSLEGNANSSLGFNGFEFYSDGPGDYMIKITRSGTYRIDASNNSSSNLDNLYVSYSSNNGVSYTTLCSASNSSDSAISYFDYGYIVYMKYATQSYSGSNSFVQISYQENTSSDVTSSYGGCGGHSIGTIVFPKAINLFMVTGGQSGFNGGGQGRTYSYDSTTTVAGNGGGGTDIRIQQDSLYSRVIVAGGGGGSGGHSGTPNLILGGGETGASPLDTSYSSGQTYPGLGGSFGYGANASGDTNYKYGSPGGGGGWYGGGSSGQVSDTNSVLYLYNGGGSGYIYTESTAINYPSGCLLDSTYYLSDAITEYSTHTGDGNIYITCFELAPSKFFFFKTENGWVTAEKIFKKTENGWQGGEI